MHRFVSLATSAALVSFVATAAAPAFAQDPTLASALAASTPRSDTLALAIGADKVRLPKGVTLPPPAASPLQVGRAFGLLVRPFGEVTAIAPATMVILGTPPAKANPWDGMPPGDLFKILAGTFTEEQWKAILSEKGLGLSDLSGENQQDQFRALFPDGTLKVTVDVPDGPDNNDDIRDVSNQLPQARLRLGQRVSIGMPVAGEPKTHTFAMTLRDKASSPRRYRQVNKQSYAADRVDGALVRSETSNRPKAGQLNLDSAAFQVRVPFTGVKTVGELMERISKTTRVEIYADHRYEVKSLTLLGGSGSATAANLLRALALCVTGTYRKVDTAFVLTDDVPGIGVRRQLWEDFEKQGEALRRSVLDKAGDAIYEKQPSPTLPGFSEPLALSPEQKELATRARQESMKRNVLERYGLSKVELPLNQLTPEQQASAKLTYERYNRQKGTLEGTFIIQSAATMELLLPSLDGPVQVNLDLMDLFQPSQSTIYKQLTKVQGDSQAEPPSRVAGPSVPPSIPPLKETLSPFERRAVYAQPRNVAQLEALIASMKLYGFNELWLDIFSGGTAHIPGSPLSSPEAQKQDGDILTKALATTKNSDIRVYAVMDLLTWNTAAAAKGALPDLSLLGKTSAQEAARKQANREMEARSSGYVVPAPSPEDTQIVSLSVPGVQENLITLSKLAAKHTGVAGLVWRDATPPGYSIPKDSYIQADLASGALGYNEAMRLAFLRQKHSDPIDLFPNEYSHGRADTKLPLIDDFATDKALNSDWGAFRGESHIAFLRKLAVAVPNTPVLLPAMSEWDQERPPWYGSWDTPTTQKPPFVNRSYASGEPPPDNVTQAKNQSKATLVTFPFGPGMVAPQLSLSLLEFDKAKGWSGIFLDSSAYRRYAPAGAVYDISNPLATLSLPLPKAP
jgi:hypothetical protein